MFYLLVLLAETRVIAVLADYRQLTLLQPIIMMLIRIRSLRILVILPEEEAA